MSFHPRRAAAAALLWTLGCAAFVAAGQSAPSSPRPLPLTAAPFGAALHVSGTDRAALETAIKPYRRPPFRWTEVPPTLEDVFIQLMGRAEDNVQ